MFDLAINAYSSIKSKKPLLHYALGISIIAFLAYYFDWQEIKELFTQISVGHLLPLLLLQLATALLATGIWMLLLAGIGAKINFTRLLTINLAGIFIDNVTPGAKLGGEGARLYWFKKYTTANYTSIGILLIIHKVITLTPLALLCVPGIRWLAMINPNSQFIPAVKLTVSLIAIGAIGTVLVLILSNNSKDPAGKKAKIARWQKIMSKEKFKKNLPLGVGLVFILWLLYPVKLYLLAKSVHLSVGFFPLGKAGFLAYLVGMLPITPGGLGTFDVALTSFFTLLGGAPAKIGVMLLMYRLITYLVPTIWGGLALLVLTAEEAKIKREAVQTASRKAGC